MIDGDCALGGAAGVVEVLHDVDVGAVDQAGKGEVTVAGLGLISLPSGTNGTGARFEERKRKVYVNYLSVWDFLCCSPDGLGVYVAPEGGPCAA